jgi:hypothetical protein
MENLGLAAFRWRRRRLSWLAGCLIVMGFALATSLAAHDVVINEILYHPPNDLELAQFIELYNRGSQPAEVSGWSFTKGVHFQFPPSCIIPAHGFLVLCRHRETFLAQYGQPELLVGGFTNRLSHHGERIELRDAQGELVDAVKYADGGAWPTAPDGYSASLERICPEGPSAEPANWAPSKLRSPDRPGGTPGRRNDSFSLHPPPAIAGCESTLAIPDVPVTVRAKVADRSGVAEVNLLYSVVAGGRESPKNAIRMRRVSGNENSGSYEAAIPAQPADRVVRWRLQAVDGPGAVRFEPAENEPRPTFTYATFVNTNTARIPFAFIWHNLPAAGHNPGRAAGGATAAFGNGLCVQLPVGGGEPRVFDYVGITPRRGGFKLRFQKDRMWEGISTLNVVYEGSPRYPLSEALAYELFRLADVPASLTGHLRLWEDGRPQGYQLTFEQPNPSFLRRNGRDDTGELYKCMYGNYEKRSHVTSGRSDLAALIQGLRRRPSDEQWRWLETNLNIREIASYYAVNMCIQNWDGFFNNHYAYRIPGGAGRWEIYPWDEDKTWGDYDGASPRYDWYTMPLTFGMNGDRPVGEGWWRGPGEISGPLLAHPEFRRRFLGRLRALCETVFTPEKLLPFIDALGAKLEPEIEVRARLHGENPTWAKRRFQEDLKSLRNQVQHRREFIRKAMESHLYN